MSLGTAVIQKSYARIFVSVFAAIISCSPSGAATQCRPPRHYRFTSPHSFALKCNPAGEAILDVTIPDRGRAVARAELPVANRHPAIIYYHSTRISVGTPDITSNSGADVCPKSKPLRRVQILGSGVLTDANPRVRVLAHQGAASCIHDQIVVASGALLDVWVEDSAPACAGKYISAVSFQAEAQHRAAKRGGLFYWDADGTLMHRLHLVRAPGVSYVKFLSSVEGTPASNPNNACGRERGRVAIEHHFNGARLKRQSVAVPASLGMGHAMLGLETDIPLTKEKSVASLIVSKDIDGTEVTTGGCCGDGIFVAIQY